MTYEVHLMVGVPASGKSTFVEQEMEGLEADGYTCAHISRDAVRFSMLGEDDEYFDREKEVFDEFVRQVNESMEVGIDNVCRYGHGLLLGYRLGGKRRPHRLL